MNNSPYYQLVGVPTLSQKQVLGSSIFASWGGTHRALAENKKHNWENTIFLKDRRQVESGTRHSHTTCGTQVKKHLRPPSHPAMDQRLLLKSPLAKNNKYFATALPCLAGHACGDCRKTYPIPIIPLSTYLSCQVVSTSPMTYE